MIRGLENITDSHRLTKENTKFYRSETGLLFARIGDLNFEGRVFFALAFPFEAKDEFICIQNEEKEELGMIRFLADFPEETATVLKEEIAKKYFAPKIHKILKLQERYGNTFWDCDTDHGKLSFTVKDTHRSLIRAGEDRIFVVDCDGCRYEIESVSHMDKKSYSKIELYL